MEKLARWSVVGTVAHLPGWHEVCSTDGLRTRGLARGLANDARIPALQDTILGVEDPSWVHVLDLDTSSDHPVVIVGWTDTATLEDTLKQGPVPEWVAVDWGLAVSRGLASLHRRGWVHGDLHAGVLIDPTRPRFLDLGLHSDTPTWPAPELALGVPPSARTDLYALGACLLHAISGAATLDTRLLDACGVAPGLATLITALLAPAATRPFRAHDVAARLAALRVEVPRPDGDLFGNRPALPPLPPAPDPLLGRDDLLVEIQAVIASGRHGAIVLQGPGGVGKTAVGLALGHTVDKAIFCEAAPCRTTDALVQHLGAQLALDTGQGLRGIAAQLAPQGPLLLVLDNVEQLEEAPAAVASLMQGGPELTIVVTTQHGLGVEGERVVRVEPLQPVHAKRLFLQCVATHGGSALEDVRVDEVLELLEGFPLLLQMAAARAASVGLHALLTQLHQGRLTLSATQDAGRHGSARKALSWSWALLTTTQRSSLRALVGMPRALPPGLAVALIGGDDPWRRLAELRATSWIAVRDDLLHVYAVIREFVRDAPQDEEPSVPDLGAALAWARERAPLPPMRFVQLAWVQQHEENLRQLVAVGPEGEDRDHLALSLVVLDQTGQAYGRSLETLRILRPSHLDLRRHQILLAANAARFTNLEHDIGWARELASEALPDPWAAVGFAVTTCIEDFSVGGPDIRAATETIGPGYARALGLQLLGVSTLIGGHRHSGRADLEAALASARAAGAEVVSAFTLANLGVQHMQDGDHERGEALTVASLDMQAPCSFPAVRDIQEANVAMARVFAGAGAQVAPFLAAQEMWRRLGSNRVHSESLIAVALSHWGIDEAVTETSLRQAWLHCEQPNRRCRAGCLLAAWMAEHQRLDEAEALLEELENIVEPYAAAVSLWSLAHTMVARARGKTRPAGAGHETWAESRWLLRRLSHDLTATPALMVHPEGASVRLPGAGPPIELGRRTMLRRLLTELARASIETPGASVPAERLVEAVWPGERILPHAARNRLNVALSKLRTLGLRDVLETTEDGYRFDPNVPVAWAVSSK